MNGKKHTGRQTGKAFTETLHCPAGGVRLQTFVPWTLVRRGLKKAVISPPGVEQSFDNDAGRSSAAPTEKGDSPLLRALGLAHHWQRLLEEGRFASLTEIAEAENIDLAQASKIIRLTQLAPDLVEGIVNGRIEAGASQFLRGKLFASWPAQRKALCGGAGARIS